MKVSIITVCKNAESAIERTMLSVVTQSCFSENIEYLIIDGASTDKTLEIIKQYADKYPIKWISEPDSGIYNAMNKGIKLATGDYLLFLNAGDYLVHYNVIKSLMNLFESNEFDVIYGNVLYIKPSTEQYLIKKTETLNPAFFFYNSLAHQGIFYKKNLFEIFGLYNENFKILADNVFNKKIICDEHIKIKYVDHIVSFCSEDGISATNIKLLSEECKIFQQQYFNKEELYEVRKYDIVKNRASKKSFLRFCSKIFIRLYEHWINR